MKFLLLTLLYAAVYSGANAQCKTYRLLSNGDTLNCTDLKGERQGKWVIHVDELRGEPGFEEEGIFKNNKREGKWRKYSLEGDLLVIENYAWGEKNGKQEYFYRNRPEHEESWLAIDPKKKYDTIDVPDLFDPYKVERKVIKVQSYSVKHGEWKYYNTETMQIMKTENYILDSLYTPVSATSTNPSKTISSEVNTTDSLNTNHTINNKPKAVLDFEKKSSKKKKNMIRDGRTGG